MAQTTRNASVAVTTTSVKICDAAPPGLERVQIVITNVDTSDVVTITKGDTPAVALAGIILNPNVAYLESNDSGFQCWQGQIQGVSSATGNIAVVETFRTRERQSGDF